MNGNDQLFLARPMRIGALAGLAFLWGCAVGSPGYEKYYRYDHGCILIFKGSSETRYRLSIANDGMFVYMSPTTKMTMDAGVSRLLQEEENDGRYRLAVSHVKSGREFELGMISSVDYEDVIVNCPHVASFVDKKL